MSMSNTFITNQGITKTIIHNNNQKQVHLTNWDADYDGNFANISIDSATNGKQKHIDMVLDNNDLANLLNIPSVNTPIDKRLQIDFQDNSYKYKHEPTQYLLKMPSNDNHSDHILKKPPNKHYLSSPAPFEELIIKDPLFKRHRGHNKTYKVYKRHKFKSKNKSHSKQRKSKYRYSQRHRIYKF